MFISFRVVLSEGYLNGNGTVADGEGSPVGDPLDAGCSDSSLACRIKRKKFVIEQRKEERRQAVLARKEEVDTHSSLVSPRAEQDN